MVEAEKMSENMTMDNNNSSDNKMEMIHSIIFNMLCEIDKICKDNNIQYYLSGGTCLGAIRHNGFIPWDDDADIMIPRPDYIRFIRCVKKKYSDKYGIASCETDRDWIRPAARIWDKSTIVHYINIDEKDMGVFIDIFPIDGLPDNKYSRKLYYKKLKLLQVLRNSSIRKSFTSIEKYHLAKNILGVFTRKLNARSIALRMNIEAQKYDYSTSKLVGVSLAVHYGDRETISRDCMDSEVRKNFNGVMLPVPVGYDKYLSNLYGDYMKLPDEDKRVNHTELYELYISGEEKD